MKFTGERYVSDLNWAQISYEHWHRYFYATQFVKGKDVLDIASGEGYGANLMAQTAKTVVGVDISQETIDFAKEHYPRSNLSFLLGSVENIPIDGVKKFDVAVSFETIEHLDAVMQECFLKEVKRLLKDDGIFVVSSPNKLFYSDIPKYKNEFHLREFYEKEFVEVLRKYFGQVSLLGQKVFAGSDMWQLDSSKYAGSFVEYQITNEGQRFVANDDKKEALYLVALCSDSKIEAAGNSVLLDKSLSILSERDRQLATLNQAIYDKDVHINNLSHVISVRDSQIQQMQAGIVMQLLERYRKVTEKLLRQGTRRRYYYELGLSGIRVTLNEGWCSFWLKTWKWISIVFDGKSRICTQNVTKRDLSSLCGQQRIKIAAVTMVYNEALVLPYFLRHYKYLDKIHVLYETDSTDESLEILNRARNVVVKKCHIEGGIDDIEKINIINSALHDIEADWVYVVDPDEFIFPPNESPYDFLKRQNYDVVRSTMYQVYRHRTDKELDPLLSPVPQRIHGDPDLFSTVQESNRAANSVYIKPNVVRPSSKVRFAPGHHEVYGNCQISPESYIGAHWQMADPSIAVRRRMERKARISKRNKAYRMGWQHYDITEDWISAECERHLDDAIIDALCSFSEEPEVTL